MKTGWISSNAVSIRTDDGELPRIRQFAWDLVGPSYLSSIAPRRKGKPQPGFVCADIIIDREVDAIDLRPFLSKWDVLRSQRGAHRFQPMFIAENFESTALMELRKRGCFLVVPEVVFGASAAKSLRSLIGILEDALKALAQNPSRVFELLHRIGKLEGAANNLRGIFLELLIAHLYMLDGYSVKLRVNVHDDQGLPAEIDVLAVHTKEVVCCECKGMAPGNLVDAIELKDWIGKSLPRMRKWIRKQETMPEKLRFEFYSSTGFTTDAWQLARKVEETHKKTAIRFCDSSNILSQLSAKELTPLRRMFNEQFFR